MLLEVCVDTLESAINAQKGGAHRIELCADLALGGTTPSFGLMKLCREKLTIPIHVMIRPRSGDFSYNILEYETMKEDIKIAKMLQMDGVVLGILGEDGNIDKRRMKELIELAKPMSTTIHRAFDMSKDMGKSIEDLVEIKIDRILTSAGSNKVTDNLYNLKNIVKLTNKRIKIMAGSGIHEGNVEEIIKCGVDEVHASCKYSKKSSMNFRKENISMGASSKNKEYLIDYCDENKVKKLIEAINATIN